MVRTTPPDSHAGISIFGGVVLTILATASMYGVVAGVAALRMLFAGTTFAAASVHIREDLLTLTLAQLLGMASALFVGLRIFAPDDSLAESIGARPVRSRALGLCLLAGLCLQFPLAELANMLHHYVFGPRSMDEQLALQNLLDARSMRQGTLVVTCLVALVPAAEELFFRGFLLLGFARRHGPVPALIASSCLFGLMHLGAVSALYATVAGLVLGLLALWTRSVFPGIALHAAVNAVPVLLPARVLAIDGFNVPSPEVLHLPPWLVWLPLAVAAVCLALVRRIEYAHER